MNNALFFMEKEAYWDLDVNNTHIYDTYAWYYECIFRIHSRNLLVHIYRYICAFLSLYIYTRSYTHIDRNTVTQVYPRAFVHILMFLIWLYILILLADMVRQKVAEIWQKLANYQPFLLMKNIMANQIHMSDRTCLLVAKLELWFN